MSSRPSPPATGCSGARWSRSADHGFDATTVADVAAAAGVSHLTFFRHLPTREPVVLDDPYDPVVAAAVVSQPRHLTALVRARRGFLAAWVGLPEPADEQTRQRVAVMAAHPGLRARAWQDDERTQDVVVAALVGTGVPRREARVAAGACVGALMAAVLDWARDTTTGGLGARVVAALGHLQVPEAAGSVDGGGDGAAPAGGGRP